MRKNYDRICQSIYFTLCQKRASLIINTNFTVWQSKTVDPHCAPHLLQLVLHLSRLPWFHTAPSRSSLKWLRHNWPIKVHGCKRHYNHVHTWSHRSRGGQWHLRLKHCPLFQDYILGCSTFVFPVIWQGIFGTIFSRKDLKCILFIIFLHAGPHRQTSLGGKLVSTSMWADGLAQRFLVVRVLRDLGQFWPAWSCFSKHCLDVRVWVGWKSTFSIVRLSHC